jgi:hypothetical protein
MVRTSVIRMPVALARSMASRSTWSPWACTASNMASVTSISRAFSGFFHFERSMPAAGQGSSVKPFGCARSSR